MSNFSTPVGMTGLTALLVQAQAHGSQEAAAALQMEEKNNLPQYLHAMASELADQTKPPPALQLAGLMLKNCFEDTRSDAGQKRKEQLWVEQVPEPIQTHVRACLLKGLVSPIVEARRSASQAVAALGTIDLTNKKWPELIPTLMSNATSPLLSDDVKVNTLSAMGYLCETLSPEAVTSQEVDLLLTAIVESMKADKPDQMRLAATKALNNALDFAATNMQRKPERDQIVTKICEASIHASPEIRRVAFECMVRMAQIYYDLLSEYMDAFYKLTFQSVNRGDQPNEKFVALQALEFWATLCEVETEMQYEEQDHRKRGLPVPPEIVPKNYVRLAAPTLFEVICRCCLKKQSSDFADESDWNLHMGGATLLGLMAQCVNNDLVPMVIPFVQSNLLSAGPENWRNREAALMAFGKILDGPQPEMLEDYVRQALPFIIQLLDRNKEPNKMVRDTAAWVLAVICQLHLPTVSNELAGILTALLLGLEDDPHVAATCAYAIEKLAIAVYDLQDDIDAQSNALSRYAVHVLPRLVHASERREWNEFGLRANCYEAINAFVEASAPDTFTVVSDLLNTVIYKLKEALSVHAETTDQKEEVEGLVQYCCGTILVVTQRLGAKIGNRAQHILFLVIGVMNLHNSSAAADAFIIAGSVANAIGKDFIQYADALMPHLLKGLRNFEDYQVCRAAAEAVSDVARAIGPNIANHAPQIIQLFYSNLANVDLQRDVKPATLSAIGDMAMAMGPSFQQYADQVLFILQSASGFKGAHDDPDLLDYVANLREANLEAYTGIIQGLGRPAVVDLFIKGGRIDPLLNFIVIIAQDLVDSELSASVTVPVLRGAAGVIGDICNVVGEPARQKVRSAPEIFRKIFEACAETGDSDVQEVARWSQMQCGL